MWALLVAVGFFFLSHPRELFPSLTVSLWRLTALSTLVVLIDIRRVRLTAPPWPVVLFLALCLTSALWSVSPADTFRAAGLYSVIAVFAWLVVSNTHTQTLLRGIVWGALMVAGATLYAVWLEWTGADAPMGVTPIAGFHGNRNVVSYVLVLGMCAALSYRPQGRFRLVRRLSAICVLLGMIFLARSGTGMIAALVLLFAAGAINFSRRRDLFATLRAKVIGVTLVVGITAVSMANLGAVAALLGKRTNLSGRGPLWDAILSVWSSAPVGGYGFGAVWSYSWFSAHPNEPKTLIDIETGSWLSHGHNIVLDLLPQLGIVGVISLLVILITSVRWLFVHLDDTGFRTALWVGLGTLGILLCGLTEPMLAVPLGWFVIVATSASARGIKRGGRADPERSVTSGA